MAHLDYGAGALPGTIGMTRIGGLLGWFVGLGQFLIGDASRWTHAFVVLDDGTVIEAMPSGARIAPLARYLDGRPLLLAWQVPLTDEQRRAVVTHGRGMLGVRYGFSDYASLALARLGLRPRWLERYIAGNGRMICSQLVDEVYRRAGVHLFDDGRMPHDVTPGDIAGLLLERDWRATWPTG